MGTGLTGAPHGMFAFALWDKTTKKLIIARDRFGKKPLYFRNWRGSFAFGSRFDAIEALTETAQLSHDALSWLLTLKYIPDPFARLMKFKIAGRYVMKLRAINQPSPNGTSRILMQQPCPSRRQLKAKPKVSA